MQVDDLLTFRQFTKKAADDVLDVCICLTSALLILYFTLDLQYDEDVGRATGTGEVHEDFISNLSRISQLTGICLSRDRSHMYLMFTNRILGSYICRGVRENSRIRYCAGFVILLHIIFRREFIDRLTDVLLVNQTSNTLQNLCIDFATLGDLKIVERPTVYTMAPNGFQSIKATIKVSSTETGVIFGSILWDAPDLSEQAVILSDIHVDIMDYIKPAYCTEAQARLPLASYSAFIFKYLTACFFTIVVPRHVDRVRMGEPSQCVYDDVVCTIQVSFMTIIPAYTSLLVNHANT